MVQTVIETTPQAQSPHSWEAVLLQAGQLAAAGNLAAARHLLSELDLALLPLQAQGQVANDLGVLATLAGDLEAAERQFAEALVLRPGWTVPLRNQQRLQPTRASTTAAPPAETSQRQAGLRTRVAIVSLLFNWPSSGGGTVHTAETARFLHRAGYEVRHLSIRFDPWGLGQVREPADWPLRELNFAAEDWSLSRIQQRIRTELAGFQPDAVIVTDSWSMRCHMAKSTVATVQ